VKTLWEKTSAIRKKECRHQQYQSQIKSNQIKYQTEIKNRKKQLKTNKLFGSFSVHSCSLLPFLNSFSHAASGFVSRSAGFAAEVTYWNLTDPRCCSS